MSPNTPKRQPLAKRVARRASWTVRDRWPDRKVRRDVQGVQLVLPWAHRLPDYANSSPEYGQNLPRLAAALAKADGHPLNVVDVGANIGDSALQILAATDGRVLCVEGDRFYLDFLHLNVDSDPRVSVEESLVHNDSADVSVAMAPVRVGGTTRFTPGESTLTAPMVSMTELRQRHPDFDAVRLVKSDTDGYDVELIPGLAKTWADSKPVLFFEYDHPLSRLAGNEPLGVWNELVELGYEHVGVWDNGGSPLGLFPIAEVPALAAVQDLPSGRRAHVYWDVAVVHEDDAGGLMALKAVLHRAVVGGNN